MRVVLDARYGPALKGGDRCRYELLKTLNGRAGLAVVPVLQASSTFSGPALRTTTATNRHPAAELYEQGRLPLSSRWLQPDLYHGTFQSLPGVLRAAPAQVLTVHDTAVYDRPELFSRQFRALARPQFAASVRAADHIICVTETTRQSLEARFPRVAGRTSVVLNGVDSVEFSPAHASPARLRELAIPTPYVLFVGNLEPKKNLPRLTAAFAQLADLGVHLVVVGAKPDGSSAEALTLSPQVHLTGFLAEADLPVVYAGASLVAYPSTYEGFGMPVLEGMASGVPVLTSDASCLPEVAGGAALLVDPLSVESIEDGLRRGLTDTTWRAQAVEQGRARARSLSWTANGDATVEIYRALAG